MSETVVNHGSYRGIGFVLTDSNRYIVTIQGLHYPCVGLKGVRELIDQYFRDKQN